MGFNLIEKIINNNTVKSINDYSIINVDYLMGHDGTASLIVDNFKKKNLKIWNNEKVLIVFDHFAPPASVERANIQKKLMDFVLENKIDFKLYEGICHQLLLEHSEINPGKIVIGADSHTTTIGSLGCLSFGIGSTDFMNILISGKIWIKKPKIIKITFFNKLKDITSGKDVTLFLFDLLKNKKNVDYAIEFYDSDLSISMDNRATICNMAVDLGAKTGVFIPDEITKLYCIEMKKKFMEIYPDKNANYDEEYNVDLSGVMPMLSLPNDPSNVCEVGKFNSMHKIQQVFFGSCTGGRISDAEIIYKIIDKYEISREMKKIFIPSSNLILKKMIELNYLNKFIEKGITVCNSSCGPCCNIDKGLSADFENIVSTSNRNFLGRMGSVSSNVFLASSLTTALVMVKGILNKDIYKIYE